MTDRNRESERLTFTEVALVVLLVAWAAAPFVSELVGGWR